MLSDLDAIDDALANAGARNASKFRPKVGKLLEKKAGKPSAAVRNVDAQMPKESASVPQTDSQLPTLQVDATHGVVINGAMVTAYQSNEENLQGKQMLGSSFEVAYMGAEASLGIENDGESSFFSILHETIPDVDVVAGGILGRPINDAGTQESFNVMENPLVASSEDVCYDLDRIGITHTESANNGSLLDNQCGQSFTPLQHDQLISNDCNALEEPPFSSYPFPQNAYDTNLEMGEADEREQAVGSSMNDELLGDVDKDEIFHVADLDGETTIESKSIRKTRKRKDTPLSHVDEASAEGKDELTGTAYEASDSAGVDESGSDEDFSEGKRKRVAKGKRQLPEEPKQKQKNQPNSKRKAKANEGPNSSKKEPKKKFSHSTRRNRKLMDETLLETPDDEINPRTLILKDLILLAEMKEKKLNKAATIGSYVTPESDEAGFVGATGDETFQRHSPNLNGDGDEINQTDESTRPKLNYHSYMKRTPSQRWSNADTELFYKALRQFGTDFEMIQRLFPGRTRHQVKLKYKKEERKHPLQLADALVNRSKDHTHFQLVIDQLQSQAESVSCKSTRSPDIDGQTGEADDHFKDYNNLGSHETRDIDEWSHDVFDNTSPDYVGKDDYSDYYQ